MSGLTLAISTASPALSLALFDADHVIAHDHRVIGRGHAEAIMPAIAALLAAQPRPAMVLVDIGPGSFTGIRIGIAAARALGLAWGVPVAGLSGAALVAAQAFALRPDLPGVRVVLDGGRGQLLVGDWDVDFGHGDTLTLAPEAVPGGMAMVGAGTAFLHRPGDTTIIHTSEPDAQFARLLPVAARDLAPAAHYVRPLDARIPGAMLPTT